MHKLHSLSVYSGITGSLSGSATTALSASYVSGGVTFPDGLDITGSLTVTGSLILTGSFSTTRGITGSLFGTSSWANNVVSASFATSASWAPGGTASFPYIGNADITGSLRVSGSIVVTGGTITGSLFGTSSWANNATSSSFATTASYAITASKANQFDGFVDFPSGLDVTGSLIVTGSTIVTGSVSATLGFSGSLFGTSSWAQSSSVAISASFAPTILPSGVVSSSTQINTGSFSGSFTGTLIGTSSWAGTSSLALLANTASYFDGFITFPSGLDITGSLVVTGSQTIIGNQTITGSLILSSSAPVELQVVGDAQITGSLTIPAGNTISVGSTIYGANFINFGGTNALLQAFANGTRYDNAVATAISTADRWQFDSYSSGRRIFRNISPNYQALTTTTGSGTAELIGIRLSTTFGTPSTFRWDSSQPMTSVLIDPVYSASADSTGLGTALRINVSSSVFPVSKITLLDVGFNNTSSLVVRNNAVDITGSVNIINGGITSSLFGTSSWANNAVTASAANSITFTPTTASYAQTASVAISSSFAVSASWAPGVGGAITSITAGDGLTGGTITSTGTITLDTGSLHFLNGVKAELNAEGVISSSIQINTGSFSGSFTGQLIGTSSWANNAISASFATTASFALNAGAGSGFPFSGSAVITGSLLVSGSGATLQVSGAASVRDNFIVNGGTLSVDAPTNRTNISGSLTVTGSTTILGSFAATTKSFKIDHQRLLGKSLIYGVLEGPEHAVYARGKVSIGLTGTQTIYLPDEWEWLVDADSITVQLTSIGTSHTAHVKEIGNNRVIIQSDISMDCFYLIHATRKDVNPLQKVQ
jgi:fibronectin-binding autotransporter adhesin